MPIVMSGSTRIYWRSDGDASLPGLVLGNSLGTDFSLWDPILDRLMEHFYVVRYDMRGHGGSDAVPVDYTIDQLTDDAQAVIKAAKLTTYDYWGISLGGMVGMCLGARQASGLRKLVLSNTAAEFDPAVWPARIAAVREGGMAGIVDAVLGRFYTPGFLTKNSMALKRMRNTVLSHSPEGYIGCCAAIRDMQIKPQLAKIQVPALIVAGEFDQSTPPSRAHDLGGWIKDSRVVSLPSAHIPVTEIPDDYFKAVVPGFLKA